MTYVNNFFMRINNHNHMLRLMAPEAADGQWFEIWKGFFVVLMCLHGAQTHENNKIYLFIRMVGLYFELLADDAVNL